MTKGDKEFLEIINEDEIPRGAEFIGKIFAKEGSMRDIAFLFRLAGEEIFVWQHYIQVNRNRF